MANPVINPDVGLSPVEGGYLAYDSVRDKIHELNALGALIAELCDGSRSVEDIHALVGPLLPEGQSGEIDRWIGEAVEAGLLYWGGPPRELSIDELSTLAGHFQGSGKYEAAYQCAKRVTELKPEDSDAWHALGWAAQAAARRDEAGRAFAKYLEYLLQFD